MTDANHGNGAGTNHENGLFAVGKDFGAAGVWIDQAIVYGPNNFGHHYNWPTDLYLESSADGSTWTPTAQAIRVSGASTITTLTSSRP